MDSNWIVTADPARLAFNGWLFAVALLFVLWLVECWKEDAGWSISGGRSASACWPSTMDVG
jgi:hypothetical protein